MVVFWRIYASFFSERAEILTQTPVAKPSSEILSRIYKRCVRQAENRMYRKVPVRLGKGRWETYTTTVVKGTHRFLHGCYGRRNALLGTTKTADLTGPCPIKSDGYPSRILYSVSLQALKKSLKQSAGNGSHKRFAHSLSAGQSVRFCPHHFHK